MEWQTAKRVICVPEVVPIKSFLITVAMTSKKSSASEYQCDIPVTAFTWPEPPEPESIVCNNLIRYDTIR